MSDVCNETHVFHHPAKIQNPPDGTDIADRCWLESSHTAMISTFLSLIAVITLQ